MRLKVTRYILNLLLCCIAMIARASNPSVTNYPELLPGAGIQNWGLTISDFQGPEMLYVGNSRGALSFDGNDWSSLAAVGGRTCRAVKAVGDTLFVAGNNVLGFYTASGDGRLNYHSLLDEIRGDGIESDEFWNIAYADGQVYFHSFGNVLSYDGSTLSAIVKGDHYKSMCQAGDEVFLQKGDGTLYLLKGDKLVVRSDNPLITAAYIRFIVSHPSGVLLLVCDDGTLLSLDGTDCYVAAQLHQPVKVECGGIYGSTLAIGTIGRGLLLFDMDARRKIDFDNSLLADRNVHALAFDSRGNLWLSLDYGMAHVDLHPWASLWRSTSDIGIFFDTADFNGASWIATNRGLFRSTSPGSASPVEIIGYPLKLDVIKDEMLLGTTNALFNQRPGQDTFTKIADANGVSQMEYVADADGKEYIITRGYSGLSYLARDNGGWHWLTNVAGTPFLQLIVPESPTLIWGIDPNTGVKRMVISPDLASMQSQKVFTDIDGCTDFSRVSLFRLGNQVLFATPNGVYEYDRDHQSFRRRERLSASLPRLEGTRTITSSNNRLAIASADELAFFTIADDSLRLDKHYHLFANPMLTYDGHLCYREPNDSTAFAATVQGILKIDRNATPPSAPTKIFLLKCRYNAGDTVLYAPIEDGRINLPHKSSDILIQVASGINHPDIYFSYRLDGDDTPWSNWQKSGRFTFPILPSGKHSLDIRDCEGNTLSLTVTVAPPFFRSTLAIIIYIVIVLALMAALVWWLQRRAAKKLAHELAEQQRQMREEQQRQAVENLSLKVKDQETELKNNLRFLTQKQELLDEISSEINSQKKELGDRWPNKLYYRLVKILDDGASSTDKFLSFENYFVEIHKDFMERMAARHPELTQSELRLCCLIRSNLSTKEIAAVMGIATRSVDLKKYRLKKRLPLDADASLTSYIFSI